jgi:predicted phage tail protein
VLGIKTLFSLLVEPENAEELQWVASEGEERGFKERLSARSESGKDMAERREGRAVREKTKEKEGKKRYIHFVVLTGDPHRKGVKRVRSAALSLCRSP